MISALSTLSPESTVMAQSRLSANHPELKCSTSAGDREYCVPFSVMSEQAPALDATPLSAREKIRLAQLERVIERGITEFISVGLALAEVRSARLYREKYGTFESYCRERFALARSSVDGLIRSTETALLLASNGAQIPEGTPEAVVRPVSALPSPELQVAGWKVTLAVSPERGPTAPIASKVCRVIKNAVEPDGNGSGHKPRGREHSARETPFLRPVQRLAAYQSFNPALVTSHIERLPAAWNVYLACEELVKRCRGVQAALARRFPELHA
jgi:hypothetical protein